MNNSLLDRFKGALLGAIIADRINSPKTSSFNWQMMSQKLIINLIENENISPENWQGIAPEDLNINSGELILGILPLILFFQETEYLCYEQIKQFAKINNIRQETVDNIMLFRKIINLILTADNNKDAPCQSLKDILKVSPSLQKIQTFLDNKIPLTEVQRHFRQQTILDINSLPLSLYCYCRTPDNFRLSILQASQINCSVITTLTGALSGAYNGFSGIPINWRLALTQEENHTLFLEQINQLWAKWTGVVNEVRSQKSEVRSCF
ncbi:MAG: ADP-ribosylglycohydrolase family protein [Crocosphaera sp.]